MPTYSVSDVLEIIKALTVEQKLELQKELPTVLASTRDEAAPPTSNQTMSGISITGSSDIAINQVKAQGESSINQNKTQATVQNTDWQEALSALEGLKQSVTANQALNPLIKEAAAEKIQAIQKETEKASPDRNLVDQALTALKKGLAGVEELAEPVVKVANLVAKAWIW